MNKIPEWDSREEKRGNTKGQRNSLRKENEGDTRKS